MSADAESAAKKFMDALHTLEKTGDAAEIVAQFADDATLLSIVQGRTHEGVDGAEAFWAEYLKPFDTIHSEFTHHAAEGNLAVLEWRGTGKLKAGRDVGYEGVSLLEMTDDGKVKRFRTYYDSAAFVTVEPEKK